MYLSSPSLTHPALQKLKDLFQPNQSPPTSFVFGVINKIFGNQWALTADKNGNAKVYNFKVKENIKPEQLVLDDPQYELVLKDNNYLIINKKKIQTNVAQEDIKRLLKQIGDQTKLGMSYIINGFNNKQLYDKFRSINKEQQDKISAAQKVTRQYFNKQLRGKQLYQIPKYLPETGNWSDSEFVAIKIKQSPK